MNVSKDLIYDIAVGSAFSVPTTLTVFKTLSDHDEIHEEIMHEETKWYKSVGNYITSVTVGGVAAIVGIMTFGKR